MSNEKKNTADNQGQLDNTNVNTDPTNNAGAKAPDPAQAPAAPALPWYQRTPVIRKLFEPVTPIEVIAKAAAVTGIAALAFSIGKRVGESNCTDDWDDDDYDNDSNSGSSFEASVVDD